MNGAQVAGGVATQADAPAAAELIDALANRRFIDSFLLQSSRSCFAMLIVCALMAGVWFHSTGGPWPLLWLTAAYAYWLWRLRATEGLVRSGDATVARRRIAALLLSSGLLLAVPVLWFQQFDDLARSVLTLVLVTTAITSLVTTSGYRGLFMVFALALAVPVALAWALHSWWSGQPVTATLAVAVLVSLVFLRSLGRHANAIFMEGCAYRFGEQQLNQELKAALAEADEANRAKTQFLAAASHDLRQPIHSMTVLVAALSLRSLDAPTREIVGLLGSVNQLLSKQLDTLLDISKLDAGVIRADFATHALDRIVRAHHAATAPLARQRGLTLDIEAEEGLWVRTDAALLTRALSNLSDNALKYTAVGGRVTLTARRSGSAVLLEVADSGIGIPADEQERVFREFYQVGNVERDRAKGLGLGLAIVRRLCRLLQVPISLESEPGRGTRVTLSVPAAPPQALAQADAGSTAQPRGLRVLVVDDEAMVRESMRLLLLGLNCEPHLADSVAEAERVARTQPLDVVLSDLRLRGGDSGLEAIRSVHRHQPRLPAVLITGDTAPGRIRDAQAAGVPLLFKPVTLEDLLAVLPARAG